MTELIDYKTLNTIMQQAVGNGITIEIGNTIIQITLFHFTEEHQESCTNTHQHNHFELSYLHHGEMNYLDEEKQNTCSLTARDGRWILIPPSRPHNRTVTATPSVIAGFALRIAAPGNPQLMRILQKGFTVLSFPFDHPLLSAFHTLLRESGSHKPERARWLMTGIVLELFIRNFASLTGEKKSSPLQRTSLENLEIYIGENLHRKLAIDDLARQANISRRQLYRLFELKYKEPIKAYIIRRRLNKAAGLLLRSNLPIKEIATNVGFDNLSYFTRKFKQTFILAPGAYRHNKG